MLSATSSNRINVFPVADGDTGTNLALTMGAVHESLLATRAVSVGELFHRTAIAAIDGARGNSGAIMAQFFFGLSESLAKVQRLNLDALSRAVAHAAKAARLALAEPQEGTVISVISSYAQTLLQLYRTGERNILRFLARALQAARTALGKTPQALPLLAQHGVVDAGGSGFVLFLEGVQRFVELGRRARTKTHTPALSAELAAVDLHVGDASSRYRYCSECLLQHANLPQLKRALSELELDSLVLAGGGDYARLHAHTDSPAQLFAVAARFAHVSQRKADDMAMQARGKLSHVPVAIVSDTGADLPESEINRLNIYTVPVRVNFGDEEFIDRVTLTPPELYQRLRAGTAHVRTSQPPGGEFRRLFDQLLSHYPSIVCLNVSSRMSGTWQAALSAATDSSDPLYPLFPQGDMNDPGSDEAAEPEPAQRDPEYYDEENIDPDTTDRVRVLASSLAQQEAVVPPPKRKADTVRPVVPPVPASCQEGPDQQSYSLSQFLLRS
ncbi:DAK2 domain-containing protein [bacterium]|nr:DAK2 domain-containing protein [bacterium]